MPSLRGPALGSGVGVRIALLSLAHSSWAQRYLVMISPAPTPRSQHSASGGWGLSPWPHRRYTVPGTLREGAPAPPELRDGSQTVQRFSLLLLYVLKVILDFNYWITHVVTITFSPLLCALRATCTGCSPGSLLQASRWAGQWQALSAFTGWEESVCGVIPGHHESGPSSQLHVVTCLVLALMGKQLLVTRH